MDGKRRSGEKFSERERQKIGFTGREIVKVEKKLRRIKRTKITVIRTETVFLQMRNGAEFANEIRQLQAAGLEEKTRDSVLEIDAIKQLEDTENEGEVK